MYAIFRFLQAAVLQLIVAWHGLAINMCGGFRFITSGAAVPECSGSI
jgi:hypothetical protein